MLILKVLFDFIFCIFYFCKIVEKFCYYKGLSRFDRVGEIENFNCVVCVEELRHENGFQVQIKM